MSNDSDPGTHRLGEGLVPDPLTQFGSNSGIASISLSRNRFQCGKFVFSVGASRVDFPAKLVATGFGAEHSLCGISDRFLYLQDPIVRVEQLLFCP